MGKRVLVVDDDPDFVEMLRDVLSGEGHDVVPCVNPKEALAKARQFLPDAIITDLTMPNANGFAIVEQLRDDPVTKEMRIIICTGYPGRITNHGGLLRRLRCDLLAKPFDLVDLLTLVGQK